MSSNHLGNRLKIASNRLPVSISAGEDGQCAYKPSSGGLIAGLRGLADVVDDHMWYGWPGAEIPEHRREEVSRTLHNEYNAIPVFLEKRVADQYYDGFSNSTMWPLLHSELAKVTHDEHTASAYREVNVRFANVIAQDLKDGDLVWIQDYHLMLLPRLLRDEAQRRNVSIRLGFFLHTPFPNEDFFTALPSKDDVLRGVLAADLIGFHTDDYRQRFQEACADMLGLHLSHGNLKVDGRDVQVKTLPIGIEPDEFLERLKKDEVQELIRDTRSTFRDMKIIVGVDRLDYTKGIPLKLRAMDKFFQDHPEQVGKVTLVQIVVPSRESLDANQALRKDVQEHVGRINGKYGSMHYVPIRFLYKSVPAEELTAFYAVADVCFICSTQDGLNLVCYEYVACHGHDDTTPTAPGVLVLSKFVGASTTLQGYLEVNPWDTAACAEVVAQAVVMDAGQARDRMKQLRSEVDSRTSFRWARAFLHALDEGEMEAVDQSPVSG